MTTKTNEPTYAMPVEVQEWIEQASSRLNHMTSEIARLKEENAKLRKANMVMEKRVMGTSYE